MNQNQLQTFSNEAFGTVRTVQIEGEPYFVGKDVAEILGYTNSRKAMSDHIDEEDKGVAKCDTLGGAQNLTVINESGLYSLVLSSKLPNAKQFKRWITSEILPTIRRHGVYAIDEMLNNPDAMIAALQQLKYEREQRKRLEDTVAIQNQQITEMQSKATYYDLILACKDVVSASVIAKDYGKSAIWLNGKLHELGIQYKQGDVWLLYQKYADKGYTRTKTHEHLGTDGRNHAKVHTYFTQKGRIFIYEKLKEHGILPMCERS